MQKGHLGCSWAQLWRRIIFWASSLGSESASSITVPWWVKGVLHSNRVAVAANAALHTYSENLILVSRRFLIILGGQSPWLNWLFIHFATLIKGKPRRFCSQKDGGFPVTSHHFKIPFNRDERTLWHAPILRDRCQVKIKRHNYCGQNKVLWEGMKNSKCSSALK